MRRLVIASALAAVVGGSGIARAQDSAPLLPYVPPPSSGPLAPLAGAVLPDDPPLGDVRAKSDSSSNISAADTRSPIAPALPDPAAAADTAKAMLLAARRAVAAGQTGAAQEALERAESRLLDRDVAPDDASAPIEGPMIGEIGAARQALSVGNADAALRAIDAALAAG